MSNINVRNLVVYALLRDEVRNVLVVAVPRSLLLALEWTTHMRFSGRLAIEWAFHKQSLVHKEKCTDTNVISLTKRTTFQ